MSTLKSFISSSSISPTLIRAVVKQFGGWESFSESAPDVCRGGIDGGFHGFIYYCDTIPFFRRHRKAILEMASQQADDFGQGVLEMVNGFRDLKEYTVDEIGQSLYGSKPDDTIANTMAWYAGEEVCRSFCDSLVA